MIEVGNNDADDVIFTILDELDRIVSERIELSNQLSKGWINIAKSRFNNVSNHNTINEIRYDIDPTTTVDMSSMNLHFLDDKTGLSLESLMLVSALPNSYLRSAQKSFVLALQSIAKLSQSTANILRHLPSEILEARETKENNIREDEDHEDDDHKDEDHEDDDHEDETESK